MKISGSAFCIIGKVRSEELSRSINVIPIRGRPSAIADQVHSCHVRAVTHGGLYQNTDGFVTTDTNIVLAIRVADCVPMIVKSQSGHVRGLIHAGREGIAAGIVENAIIEVDRVRKSEDPISVFLGPHIGPCCYRFPVDHPIGRRLTHHLSDGCEIIDGRIVLDLGREIQARLQRLGIDSRSIVADTRCTACSTDNLPSHKREGPDRTRTLLILSTQDIENKEMMHMAVDPELLKILACPETKEPVHLAPEHLVNRLNELIETGVVKNRGGEQVTEKIDNGLVREDKRYIYPIRDDIPIMLIEEAIELPPLGIPDSV